MTMTEDSEIIPGSVLYKDRRHSNTTKQNANWLKHDSESIPDIDNTFSEHQGSWKHTPPPNNKKNIESTTKIDLEASNYHMIDLQFSAAPRTQYERHMKSEN